jgi:predicted amidohydrolase YtcJ
MILLHNANIYAPSHPGATALVISHGRFHAIGSDSEILDSFSHAETIINLDGRTLWPGLTDAHVHLRHLAESMAMVDCETDTLGECLARVKAAAKKLPKEAWLRGHGWNQNRWEDGFGKKEQLDAVCRDNPAYLTAKSLHAGWVNSRALKLAGIDSQIPDPPSGIIQRDAAGQPTGILLESGAMNLIESIIPKPTLETLTAKIKALLPQLWKFGLTGVHDFDGFDCWQVLQNLHQQGSLDIRVRKNIPFDHLNTFINAGLRTDFGDDRLHIGGVKLFSDGALGPQTAAMLEPYEVSGEIGTLLLTEGDIVDIGKRAADNGLALTIHAIGDRANRIVLNAYEKIRAYEQAQGLPHQLHRIEHVQIIHPRDLPRLAALGIIASVQPIHAPSDMITADKYLGRRSKDAYAYRSLLKSGATLVFGSDAPVESVNPFYGIHAAVTRRRGDGSPGLDGWHPEERLSLEQAICGFSHTPAVIAHRGKRLGKIADGYKADFLVLNNDPFHMDPQDLWKIKPIATYLSGRCLYASKDLEF